MSVATFAAIVHVVANFEYLPDATSSKVRAAFYQRDYLLEFSKVSFLFGRQEGKPFEERNHVLDDGVEVRHLEIPNAIGSASKSPTAQVPFEESEDDSILLRYV